MVTYTPAGRLGNAMFQCAAVISYALKHKIDFHIPSETNDPYWNPIYFPHLQNPNFNPHLKRAIIMERTHAYYELPFYENWRNRNIFLEGYFQSEKYFNWCREEILKAFNFPWHLNKGTVSIHVRRGDYLMYPEKHPVVPDEYYTQAIAHFKSLGLNKFHVFSDDLDWCLKYFTKELFGDTKFLFMFPNPHLNVGNEISDLVSISWREGHINSSSTFSWWSSWLNQNPNKIIITPKQWFVPGHNGLDTKDLIPETWIKL